MISIPFTRVITGGTPPLTYIVKPKETNPECNCVSGSNLFGTVPNTGIINFVLNFTDNSCLSDAVENCEYEIVVTDSTNCTNSLDLTFEDICDDLNVQIIANSRSSNKTFSGYVTGGNPNYTYYWTYSEGPELVTSSVSLNPNFEIPFIPGEYSPYGTLTLTVTDSSGCQITQQLAINSCQPLAIDNTDLITIPCLQEGIWYNAGTICVVPCRERPIDWSTWEVVRLVNGSGNAVTPEEAGLTFFVLGLNVEDDAPRCTTLLVQTDNTKLVPGLYTLAWQIKDSIGRISNYAEVNLNIKPCPIFDDQDNYTVDFCGCKGSCTTINEQGEIRIPVTQCVLSSCGCVPPGGNPAAYAADCIDESTIQILAGPYLAGANAYFDPFKDELVYIPPTEYQGGDKIVFTGNFISGKSFGLVTWDIELNCWPDPVSEPDTACTNCCEPVVIDVLANDTFGSPLGWNLASLQIVNQPSLGSVTITNDGKIEYTAFCNVTGIDNFSYTVKDAGTNKFINATEVYVEITCAGSEQEAFFCVQPEALEADVETTLQTSGNYKVSFKAYFSNSTQLESGDELEVEFRDITNDFTFATATLVVGSDLHTPKAGTDNNWTTYVTPYLTNAPITGGALQSTNGVVSYFNKRGFALANGYANEFDAAGDFVGGDVAIDIAINLTAIDISGPMSSLQDTDYLYRVKVTVLEDTNYVDQMANPDGNAAADWQWVSSPAGTDSTFLTTGSDLHPFQFAKTWYSQFNNPLNSPPGRITFYSLSPNPLVNISSGITVNYTSEAQFQSQLTSLMQGLGYSFFFNSVSYSSLNVDFALIGNNSSMLIAYQEEADPALASVTIKYNDPAKPTNYLKEAKATLKNFVIY